MPDQSRILQVKLRIMKKKLRIKELIRGRRRRKKKQREKWRAQISKLRSMNLSEGVELEWEGGGGEVGEEVGARRRAT